MSYFSLLDLSREPFSNSPDPDFFFQSRQHVACLQKLEISIRLRRGLNVVVGDVGTGKTTLCRQLIRKLAEDPAIETHLILDPHFSSPSELLAALGSMFGLSGRIGDGASDWVVKGVIKEHLFERGVDEQKIMLLIIDEGQKIPDFALEILRELLNYEVNDYKLLQIAIFAQREIEGSLARLRNFADRISLYVFLGPLDFRETKMMIEFRLNQAGNGRKASSLFSPFGYWGVYRASGGYPRKIIHLCHRVLLDLIVKHRNRAGWLDIRRCARTAFAKGQKSWRRSLQRSPMPVPSAGAEGGGLRGGGEVRKNRPMEAVGRPNDRAGAGSSIMAGKSGVEPGGSSGGRGERPAPEAAREVRKNFPDILGCVAVRGGERIQELVREVYGVCTDAHLRSLADANPQLGGLDNLQMGEQVCFPALPLFEDPLPEGGWWVRIAEEDALDDACTFVKTYPAEGPPVKLFVSWHEDKGLSFSILLKYCFIDETLARRALEEPSLPVASGAGVLAGWPEGTVFFSR